MNNNNSKHWPQPQSPEVGKGSSESALSDTHRVNVPILYLEPVHSDGGLGQTFHVTQRSRRRRLSGDLTQKAGRKQMAVVADGRGMPRIRCLARGYYKAANSFSVPSLPGD